MNVATLVVDSQVDRVTVYRNGALVVRTATVAAPASWPVILKIPGLPLLFQSDTVRIRVLSPGLSAGPIEEEPELSGANSPRASREREREAAAHDLKALQDEDRIQAELAGFYDRLQVGADLDLPRKAPASWPDLDAWTGLTDAAEAGRQAVAERRAALRIQIREATERLSALDRRAPTEDGPTASVTRALRTVLRQTGETPPGSVALEVEYFLAGARWAPSYALDLSRDGGALLRLSAWVAQATGEDWRGVSVSVASSDLRRSAALPKLPAWKIGRAVGASPSGWRPLPEDLNGLYADFDAASPPRPAPARRPERGRGKAIPREEMPRGATDAEAPELDEAPATAFFAIPAKKMEEQARPRAGAPPPSSVSVSAASMPPPAPMAPPAPMRSRMAAPGAMPDVPRSKGGMLGRAADALAEMADGAGGGAELAPPAPPPPPPLDPGKLLDYAWLRLPTWTDTSRRGRLWPVDAFSDLAALAEERGLSSGLAPVERALKDNRAALRRLDQAPLPPGCVPLEDSSFQYRYPASARVDVPNDGRFVQITVAEGRGPGRTLFRVVPRQSLSAFRTVRLDNPLGAPLPAGPVRVTVDGDLRVAGTLQPVGAGGVIALDLGVEEGLRLARNATFHEEEKGVLSAVTVGAHRVRVEISNRLSEIAQVQIFERLPIAPEGSDLQVNFDSASPSATRDLGPTEQKLEGALRWELTVPAGGRAEINWQYTVRLPARMELIGGTRREP